MPSKNSIRKAKRRAQSPIVNQVINQQSLSREGLLEKLLVYANEKGIDPNLVMKFFEMSDGSTIHDGTKELVDILTGKHFPLTPISKDPMLRKLEIMCITNSYAWVLNSNAWKFYFYNVPYSLGMFRHGLIIDSNNTSGFLLFIDVDRNIPDDNYIFIYVTLVDRSMRKRGILRRMLSQLEHMYIGRNIALEVANNNTGVNRVPLHEIWSKFGFTTYHKYEEYLRSNGHPANTMLIKRASI